MPPLPTTPYPVSPFASGIESLGTLIPLILAIKHKQQIDQTRNQPLGQALGYPSAPTTAPMQGPMQPGPFAEGMTAPRPMLPTGQTGYPTAPAQLQPLMSKSVRDVSSLKDALGEPTMRDLFGAMGINRTPGSTLEWDDATQGFKIKTGTTGVRSQDANVIIRQKDTKNKANLQDWRDAVEKRLARGQLSKEEGLAMRADSDLLKFMLDPQFDELDDTIKTQLQSQATAAINRLQQRGVKVFTGERARKTAPGAAPAGAPAGTPTPPPAKSPEQRFNDIKAKNPTLTDQQIYAQMAIEEAGQ